MEKRSNIKNRIRDIDLIAQIETDLGPGHQSGKWTMWRCPFHDDHNPSLGAIPGDGSKPGYWKCFGCGKSGDIISWKMELNKLPFLEAVKSITGDEGHHQQEIHNPNNFHHNLKNIWQMNARKAIEICKDMLWKEGGEEARAYLHQRGLNDETIAKYQLGLSPGFTIGDLYLHQGVLIPTVMAEEVFSIKIRLLPNIRYRCSTCRQWLSQPGKCPHCGRPNKYRGVSGNRSSTLFGAENLSKHAQIVFCEGEFDAMLLDQECGHWVGVASLGSAGSRLDFSNLWRYLLHVETIYLVYDLDNAGKPNSTIFWWLTTKWNHRQK